ncbi:MAG TPA: acyl-CoA dehydrogenase family protein [Sphingomonadaceae bacterium]|nr:acyl-CoA dehydrogenase family protein [Sphingomonadaceae bacterium]
MPLYLTEDQILLRDTARDFMAREAPVAHFRKYRDMNCKDGFAHGLWKQFAELGFTGILVSEADGGLGMGHVEAGIVCEEVGRNLTPSPFLISAVAVATALRTAPDEVRARWLPGIVAGEAVAAFATDEGPKHRSFEIAMTAEPSGNGYKLTGEKRFVVQAASADLIVVSARTPEGIALFAVERGADGLTVDPARLVDGSMGAHLRFDGVQVDAPIGDEGALRRVLRAGRVGAASELVGVGTAAAEQTVAYLKERKQFGRVIGEYQALQHRQADLYAELEIARAATLKAQQLLDEDAEDAALMTHVAKAKAGRASTQAVQEGVQMFGGVGMTDEYDIGLYMKRDRALNELWGDPNYHTDRLARLKGY